MTAKTFEEPARPKPKMHKRSEDRAIDRGVRGVFRSLPPGEGIPSPADLQKVLEDPAPATLTMCGMSPVSLTGSRRLTDDWERVTCRRCLASKPEEA